MKIVVLKFGGTSVGTIEKIKKVSRIIGEFRKKKYKVIVKSILDTIGYFFLNWFPFNNSNWWSRYASSNFYA